MSVLKYVATALLALAVIQFTAMPASADAPAPEHQHPVNASVVGGSLTATLSGPANPLSITLSGDSTLSTTSPAAAAWTLADARGTGAPWGLSVSGTDFVSAPGDTDSAMRTLPIEDLSLSPGTINSLSEAAIVPTGGFLRLSKKSQILITAAADAMGTFSFTPRFTLTVDGSTFRSNFIHGTSGPTNAYISTLTFTIA